MVEAGIKQLLGDGPYPFPIEGIERFLEVYHDDRILIIVPKIGIDFFEASHCHSSYEFFVPFTNLPARVEKTCLMAEKDKVLPINPEQSHGPGPSVRICGVYFMTIQINKEFISDLSRLIYRREEVFFQNRSFLLDRNLDYLVRQFMEESRNRQAGYQFILQSLGTQIAVSLFRQVKNNLPALIKERNYSEKKNINKAIEFLRSLYNCNYSLEEVARVANLSPYHFIRVFKSETGKTPYDYLLDLKIEKACEMLRVKQRTVTEICFSCGFNNLSHFTAIFRRKVGMSPSEYSKHFWNK